MQKTRLLEGFFCTCLVTWGVNVAYNPTVFALPVYSVIEGILPRSTWASIAILIAIFRLAGLIINGYWRRSPLIRGFGTLCSGLFWMFLGGLVMLTSMKLHVPAPPGGVFYPVFFVFEAYCMIAAGYDTQRAGALTLGKV